MPPSTKTRKSPSVARAIKLKFGQGAYEAYKKSGAIPPGYGATAAKIIKGAAVPAAKAAVDPKVPPQKSAADPINPGVDKATRRIKLKADADALRKNQKAQPKDFIDLGRQILAEQHETKIPDELYSKEEKRSRLEFIVAGIKSIQGGPPPLSQEKKEQLKPLVLQRRDLESQIREQNDKISKARAAAINQVLKDIRPMGITKSGPSPTRPGSDSKLSRTVEDALDHLPTDWVDAVVKATGGIQTKRLPPGMVSGLYDQGVLSMGGNSPSTAAHELMHAVEDTMPRVKQLETQYFRERTGPDPVKEIFGEDVQGKKDSFAEPYFGRMYADGSLEILAMGVEGLFHGKYNMWKRDPETAAFITGLLAAA